MKIRNINQIIKKYNSLKNQDKFSAWGSIQDSYPYMHDKKFAIWGDPDFLAGMVSFVLEMGAEPTHVLCNNPGRGWEEGMRALFDTSSSAADWSCMGRQRLVAYEKFTLHSAS